MSLIKYINQIAKDLISLMNRKTDKSGHYFPLGLKGFFAGGIDRKYWRLRHMIWEHNEDWNKDELKNIEEEALDMAGYSFLIIALIRKRMKEGKKNEKSN